MPVAFTVVRIVWVRRKKNQRRIEVATGGIFIGLGVHLAVDR
ncbi:hypothetical protein [Amycolatopsis sp. NPDC004625]